MLNIQSQEFLTKEQIKEKANSIFASKGASNTSEKYAHIPTYKIIEDMEVLGWKVTDVKQVKARGANAGFQKHLVVFRNTDIVINGSDGDTVWPQILLTNSSDGKNAFTFKAGLFRLVCENGLVISTQDFADLKIRHFGYDFSELQKTITSMVEKLPLTVESMNKFKQTKLTDKQILKFAKDALEARFGEVEMKRITIDYTEFVKATRKEDEGNDLWSVFNRVQEKVIDGDFNYGYSTKTRKARKIKNFNKDIELNSRLYEIATEYCLS
jgi:hypothetical protein